jgi:hypothetical protein
VAYQLWAAFAAALFSCAFEGYLARRRPPSSPREFWVQIPPKADIDA